VKKVGYQPEYIFIDSSSRMAVGQKAADIKDAQNQIQTSNSIYKPQGKS